jgi:hypothetical protein
VDLGGLLPLINTENFIPVNEVSQCYAYLVYHYGKLPRKILGFKYTKVWQGICDGTFRPAVCDVDKRSMMG